MSKTTDTPAETPTPSPALPDALAARLDALDVTYARRALAGDYGTEAHRIVATLAGMVPAVPPGSSADKRIKYMRDKDAPAGSGQQHTYRITTTGDGAGVTQITGTWDDLVRAVAEEMFSSVDDEGLEEARSNLEDGIDSDDGWDGKSVYLQFEDSTLLVELVDPAPIAPPPAPADAFCELAAAEDNSPLSVGGLLTKLSPAPAEQAARELLEAWSIEGWYISVEYKQKRADDAGEPWLCKGWACCVTELVENSTPWCYVSGMGVTLEAAVMDAAEQMKVSQS